MPIDEKILAELKLAAARSLQQQFASEYFFTESRKQHEAQAIFLPVWEKYLLPLARHYEKNPVLFCEKVLGLEPDWFAPPEGTTPRQAQEALEMALDITSFFTGPLDMNKLDGKGILKRLQKFTANPPGRKQSKDFGRALELKRAGKNIHEICLELKITGYEKMGRNARRVVHQRIRSGIYRLEQKQKQKDISQRSRNTPR
jgi:hypothetical protein